MNTNKPKVCTLSGRRILSIDVNGQTTECADQSLMIFDAIFLASMNSLRKNIWGRDHINFISTLTSRKLKKILEKLGN